MPGPWGNPKMPIPVSKGDNSTEAGTEGCSHLQGREEITIPAKKFPATESSRGLALGAGGGEKPGGIAEYQRLPRAQRVMVAQCKSTRPEGRDWARRSS